MTDISLYNKISSLPDQMKSQVSDFVDFLMSNAERKQSTRPAPKFGSGKGTFTMLPGFDEPLDDFKEYMF